MKQELIEKLIGKNILSIEQQRAKYPARNLMPEQKVTRFAPSPTGTMHIGHLSQCLISERLAHLSNGIFFLRIEDTDQKREVKGSAEKIPQTLKDFGLYLDEGPISYSCAKDTNEICLIEEGNYGSYFQSKRGDIYKSFIKYLLEKDLAYPAFETEEELEELRKFQETNNLRTGYYGEFAKSRNLGEEQIEKNLNEEIPFIIRFKSQNSYDDKIKYTDLIRGDLEFPGYDIDVPVLKSDGLPTYHLAHLVDDYLMGTTHVIRGEEWLSSVPLHIQLFKAFGFKPPKYGHISTIDTIDKDTLNRRKLSKRKDPQANVEFYFEKGYHADAVIEYLLNIANSNFEDWRKQQPTTSWREFPFSAKKLNNSGALFDFAKLDSIAKEKMAELSAKEITEQTFSWAQKYDEKLYQMMKENYNYVERILGIERGIGKNSRKDIIKFSDVKNEISYFFDDEFDLQKQNARTLLSNISDEDLSGILKDFKESYEISDTQEIWWKKIQDISDKYGYCSNMKLYKENPQNYKGNVSDTARIFRILLSASDQTPNMYLLMQVMGKERVIERISLLD
ncbi:MAG: glutamate--tRNA ligase [Rickettsiales bacterium]|jgi:glutamyl-tRNA synthetase|nr:glutamate--tRNA ligase [Rickettsiales bacterium]